MGLDTSHDCWHGGYISFMAWRQSIAKAAGLPDLMMMQDYGGSIPWNSEDPLTVLLDHSDCDGIIAAKDCTPLADRLESLLPVILEGEGGPTRQFIAGLRDAASKSEDVDFH